mgnify:CR=1 FL=1
MRNKIIDRIYGQTIASHHAFRRSEHIGYRMLIYRPTFLINKMFIMIYRLVRSRMNSTTGFHQQMRQSHTIGMQHGILHSDFLVGRF